MSYKEKMCPAVSAAEYQLFIALSKAGLTKGMTTQDTIILWATRTDCQWNEKRVAVYLDGEEVHRKRQEKDEEVKNELEMQGWKVLRLRYNPPLSKKMCQGFVEDIREALGNG